MLPECWVMCTSFTLGNQASGLIYGRTMEFTLDLHSEIIVVPAGTQFWFR